MSAKDQIKQIVDYFKREPQLKDKTDGMAEGLMLGAQLADDANELSKETDASFKALQREYTENGNGSQTTAEINVARDGEQVLDDRLKRDFGNVNAQLAQNEHKIEGLWVSPEEFGAIGDGLTNDTEAIQKAINFIGNNGGGTVYFSNSYVVSPTEIGNTGALYMKYDNVKIVGKGRTKSKIKFLTYGMKDPQTTSYIFNGKKWRGNCFAFDVGSKVVNGTVFKDIEIDGSVANIDSDSFDGSNKLIGSIGQTRINDLLIENCWIHNSFGELVYSAGINGKAVMINNIFDSTRGNGVTFSGEVTFERNEVKNTRYGGVEQALWEGKPCVYKNNTFLNNAVFHFGTQHGSTIEEYTTNLTIEGNIFGYTSFDNVTGVALTSINGATVIGNKFIDCSRDNGGNCAAVVITNNTDYLPLNIVENIIIENNTFISDKKTMTKVLRLVPPTPSGKTIAGNNIMFANNKTMVTNGGLAHGVEIGTLVASGGLIQNMIFKGNEFFGMKRYDKTAHYPTATKIQDLFLPRGMVNITGWFNLTNTATVRLYARYNTKSGYVEKNIVNFSDVQGLQVGSTQIYLDKQQESQVQLWAICTDSNATLSYEIN